MEISSLMPNILTKLVNQADNLRQLELKPGSIVSATVTELDGNAYAMLEIEGVKLRAIVDANLNAGDQVNLLVTGNVRQGAMELKLISASQGSDETQNIDVNALLKSLNLPANPAVKTLVTELLHHGTPFSAAEIAQGKAIMQTFPGDATIVVLSKMLELGIPLDTATFQAIDTLEHAPPLDVLLLSLKNELTNALQQLPDAPQQAASAATPAYLPQLLQVVNLLLAETPTTAAITSNITANINLLGVNYEQELAQVLQTLGNGHADVSELATKLRLTTSMSLKPLLLQLKANAAQLEHAGLAKLTQAADTILHQLTAQQLITQAVQAKVGNAYRFFCIPLTAPNQAQTLQLQILSRHGGKRQKIDPWNCYILLHLALSKLGNLDIHMNVIDKTIGIRVVAERPTEISALDEAGLRASLQTAGYTLGTLSVEAHPVGTLRNSLLPPVVKAGTFDAKI
ncbi:MAG: hypothetical protein M0Z55_01995 [Peptococcaceae bacterium]|nr:hypothetical protein [Peptococcaceae bacterium]